MGVFATIGQLLSDEIVRDVFLTVASEKRIRFHELKERFAGRSDQDTLHKALRSLAEAHLLEESPGVEIPEFKAYYITSEGLSVQRLAERESTFAAARHAG